MPFESRNETRCPKCKYIQKVDDDYRIYEEGSHSVWCHDCDYEYDVETYVTITIESPE